MDSRPCDLQRQVAHFLQRQVSRAPAGPRQSILSDSRLAIGRDRRQRLRFVALAIVGDGQPSDLGDPGVVGADARSDRSYQPTALSRSASTCGSARSAGRAVAGERVGDRRFRASGSRLMTPSLQRTTGLLLEGRFSWECRPVVSGWSRGGGRRGCSRRTATRRSRLRRVAEEEATRADTIAIFADRRRRKEVPELAFSFPATLKGPTRTPPDLRPAPVDAGCRSRAPVAVRGWWG